MLRVLVFVALLPLTLASPAAAQNHAAQIEDLFALRELGASRPYLALSPDGGQIALIERGIDVATDRYLHDIVVIELNTGAARQVGTAGDILLAAPGGLRSGAPLDRRPVWSPDGAYIYYTATLAACETMLAMAR